MLGEPEQVGTGCRTGGHRVVLGRIPAVGCAGVGGDADDAHAHLVHFAVPIGKGYSARTAVIAAGQFDETIRTANLGRFDVEGTIVNAVRVFVCKKP